MCGVWLCPFTIFDLRISVQYEHAYIHVQYSVAQSRYLYSVMKELINPAHDTCVIFIDCVIEITLLPNDIKMLTVGNIWY